MSKPNRLGAEPTNYEIRVEGALDQCWSDWFGGLSITHSVEGNTILAGPVADQAALYGLLGKAASLGLTLLSVARTDSNPSSSQEAT